LLKFSNTLRTFAHLGFTAKIHTFDVTGFD